MKNVGLTWAEIDVDAIAHNVKQVKGLLGSETKLMAVVKASGYGHGATEVARVALANGAEYLGVATVDEGIELRKAGIEAPILVFDCGLPEEAPLFIKYNLILSLGDLKIAGLFSKIAWRVGREVKAHVKVETGLGQDGVRPDDTLSLVKGVKKLGNISIGGIYTHFATAFEKRKEHTYEQFGRFKKALELLNEAGVEISLRHVANSAAVLDLVETHLDMVRVGSLIYGRYPSVDVSQKLDLKPVWKLKTTIMAIREFQENQAIGEGGEFRVKKGMVVATLPIGFSEGFSLVPSGVMVKPYRFLGKAFAKYTKKEGVEIKGQLAPVVGRVSSKHTMVEITRLFDVMVGETATVPADSLTISSRIPRVYFKNGQPYKVYSSRGVKLLKEREDIISRRKNETKSHL